MIFIVAEKEGSHGRLLVVTDKDILGKYFHTGKIQLDLRSPFYQGKEMSKEEVKIILKRVRQAMFTGKAAVALGIEIDLINPQKILYVQNIPHAQAVKEM